MLSLMLEHDRPRREMSEHLETTIKLDTRIATVPIFEESR
jgi:hypothetical protein